MAADRVDRLAASPDLAPSSADEPPPSPSSSKRRRTLSPSLLSDWAALRSRAEAIERQIGRGGAGPTTSPSAPVFAFVEGALVSALREGGWLLLDEVNLAPAETLERLSSVMEVRHIFSFFGVLGGGCATRLSLARLPLCRAEVECLSGADCKEESPLTAPRFST